MATKDELIDEVATLKAKIAELTTGAQVSCASDSLGMALQAGHVYHLAEMGGLDDLGALEVGKTYVYLPDGFDEYVAPEGGEGDTDKSPEWWTDHRVGPLPSPGVTVGAAGLVSDADFLRDAGMDGAKWAAGFKATAERLGHHGMDEGWLIGWFCNAIMAGYDEAARDVTINELRAQLAGGALHGSIDGLKPVV